MKHESQIICCEKINAKLKILNSKLHYLYIQGKSK